MIHEHPKFFFASLIDPKSSSLALFRSCICSIFFFSKTLHNITLVVNDLQICVYFFLFFYYYKFKSDCCESTSASCYRYLIKPVLTYYPRVLLSKMNNYKGQVYCYYNVCIIIANLHYIGSLQMHQASNCSSWSPTVPAEVVQNT